MAFRRSVVVIVLTKHSIKTFEFLFLWNLSWSFGMFIMISLVNIIFLFICYLILINCRFLRFLYDRKLIISSIIIAALGVNIALIFSNKSISKKIFILLI